MRHYIFVILYAIIAIVLEGTWLFKLLPSYLYIDLVFLGVIAVSFSHCEFKKGLYFILILGLFSGVFSIFPAGLFMLRNIIVYFVVRFVIKNIYLRSLEGRIFWIAGVFLVSEIVTAAMFFIYTKNAEYFILLLKYVWARTIVNTVVGLGVVPMLEWMWGLDKDETVDSSAEINAW